MISSLSNRITKLLCEKEIIEPDKKDVYRYGYEIFISSLISLLIVISVGILTGYILESAVFYVVFVFTRQYCGGYHANTYLKCNAIFILIYSAVLLVSNILLDFYNIFYLVIFLTVYLSAIWEFAPIDNENKRLSVDEKIKSRKISIALSFIWIILSLVLYFIYTKLSVVFTLTLFAVTMLIVIEKLQRKQFGNMSTPNLK